MNMTRNMLLLMFNLSQIQEKEKVIERFVAGINDIFKPAKFYFQGNERKHDGTVFEIRTLSRHFGIIEAVFIGKKERENHLLISNSVQILAIILEHLDFEQNLEKERDGFESLASIKIDELEGLVKDLEKSRSDTSQLIRELSGEIKKREQFDEALIESEEKFRNLFQNSPVGKSLTELNGNLNVNRSFCNLLEYSEEELMKKNMADITHPDDLKKSNEFLQSLIEGKSNQVRFEKRYISKTGKTVFADVSTYLQRDKEGNPVFFITTINDITERKLATLALKESEKKYRNLFERNPQTMWIYDLETLVILEVNNAAILNYGYSKEEFLKLTLKDIRPKEDLDSLLKDVANTSKELNNAGIWRHKKKNGEIIFVEISSHLTDYENRKARLVLVNDVTERVNAEEALKTNYSLLRVAGKMAKFGGWSVVIDDNKVKWSEEVAAIHGMPAGYSPELEDSINFYAPEWREKIKKVFNECSEKGITYDEEMQIITAKGNLVWIRTIGEAIKDESGKIIMIRGFFQDITERKQAEEEIIMLNEELEQRVIQRTSQLEAANKELEAFSYSVSHDLRAPLRAIHSFTKILKEDYSNFLDAEGKRIMGIVESSSIHMGQLIDDLLAFSRIGRTELLFSKIEMNPLAKSVFAELTTHEERNKIDFTVKKLPPAYGDPSTIKQVMTNLISNALKYSSKSKRATINIDYELNEGEIIYAVKDNGVGFDMQYVNKLFGVFQRLHSAKEFEGNGVGLAIVQRVIVRHGGRVWAKGEVGKGATFSFSLPANKVTDSRQQTAVEINTDA